MERWQPVSQAKNNAAFRIKNFQEVFIPEQIADAIDPCKTLDKYKVGKYFFPRMRRWLWWPGYL